MPQYMSGQQIPLNVLSKMVDINPQDCNKLKLFKYCLKYKKTFDDEANRQIMDLRKIVFNSTLPAGQILQKIIDEGELFHDPSSAFYITDRQLQSIKENKMDITFTEMVEMNLKRDKLQGNKYTYRAADLMWFNEQQNQLAQIQNKTQALQNFFAYMVKMYKDGNLKPIEGCMSAQAQKENDNPEVAMLKRQLKEEQEAHARDKERLDLEVQRLKDELAHYKQKLFDLEAKVNKK